MATRHPSLSLLVGVLACLILTGCTASVDPPRTSNTPSSAASTDPDGSGANDADIDPGDPPEALGSVTLDRGGEDGVDSVLIEVVGMRHTENVLVMTVRVTGEGEASGSAPVTALATLGAAYLPVLIDYENLKKYIDVPGLRSGDTLVAAPLGQPMYLIATFAYPEGASSVDVQVNFATPPIEGVPVP